MKTPLVSISCITYNHAPYIRECLEGFLMQKTNFPFEILIHDDASTDGTADIIREYQTKYPDIIKPILQTENQYSKGIRGISAKFNFPRALGKYIALCEGDDFWTDPKKLQIQFDFMEAHPDYSLCMHGRNILNHFSQQYYKQPFDIFPENGIEFAHNMARGAFVSYTQTLFFRKDSFLQRQKEFIRDCQNAPMGDAQLIFHLALRGNVRYIRKHYATYRIAAGSATHNTSGDNLKVLNSCHAAFEKLLHNNGFDEWIKERKVSAQKTPPILTRPGWRIFMGKVHFALIKFFAHQKFLYHMNSISKNFAGQKL